MQREIAPPSQDDFEADHRQLYHKKNMKSVAAHSGIHPSTFSRRLNNEEPLRDHAYDTAMELYASVASHQPEIGRGLYQQLHDVAAKLGLLDEAPVNILKLAIDQLRNTSRDDIKLMSRDDRALTEQYSGELREVAGHVYSDAIGVRNELEGSPRGSDVGGNGRGTPERAPLRAR